MSAEAQAHARAKYRLTRHSIVWLVWITLSVAFLVPYELYMVAKGVDGGPLTHVVKWMYGEPYSLRWWVLGSLFFGWSAWLAPHFMFEGWGLRALLTLVGLGLLVGLTGYLLNR